METTTKMALRVEVGSDGIRRMMGTAKDIAESLARPLTSWKKGWAWENFAFSQAEEIESEKSLEDLRGFQDGFYGAFQMDFFGAEDLQLVFGYYGNGCIATKSVYYEEDLEEISDDLFAGFAEAMSYEGGIDEDTVLFVSFDV